MKLKDLKKALSKFPPNTSVELTKVISVDRDKKEGYLLRLDFPIIGLAHDEKGGDLLLVVEMDKETEMIRHFGKLTPLGDEEDEEAKDKATH